MGGSITVIAKKRRQDEGAQRQDRKDLDPVLEAGRESFPTSDPPSWTLGVPHDEDEDEIESSEEDRNERTETP